MSGKANEIDAYWHGDDDWCERNGCCGYSDDENEDGE